MKVYFSASVSAREFNEENYRRIVKCLKELLDDNVYSEHIFNNVIEEKLERKGLPVERVREKSYEEVMGQINKADLIVAEISYPSTAVGHEISYALSKAKQVLLVHLPGKSSRLLEGIKNPNLHIVEYTTDTLRDVMKRVIQKISKDINVRFNFFIPKEIAAQLDHMALSERVNKSEYIRKLVEKDMKKNKRYFEK